MNPYISDCLYLVGVILFCYVMNIAVNKINQWNENN